MYCVACGRAIRSRDTEGQRLAMGPGCRAKYGLPAVWPTLGGVESAYRALPERVQNAIVLQSAAGSVPRIVGVCLTWLGTNLTRCENTEVIAVTGLLRAAGMDGLSLKIERDRYAIVTHDKGAMIDVYTPFHEAAKEALKAIRGRRAMYYEGELNRAGNARFRCWSVPSTRRADLNRVLSQYFAGSDMLDCGAIRRVAALPPSSGMRGAVQAATATPVRQPSRDHRPVSTIQRPGRTAAVPAPVAEVLAELNQGAQQDDLASAPPRFRTDQYGLASGEEMLYLGQMQQGSSVYDIAFDQRGESEMYRAWTESRNPERDATLRTKSAVKANVARGYDTFWRNVYSRHNEAQFSGGFSSVIKNEPERVARRQTPAGKLAQWAHLELLSEEEVRNGLKAAPKVPAQVKVSNRFRKLELD